MCGSVLELVRKLYIVDALVKRMSSIIETKVVTTIYYQDEITTLPFQRKVPHNATVA